MTAGFSEERAEEGRLIHGVLDASLTRSWEGRTVILEMRDGGSRQWRQVEWIGFYFEWRARNALVAQIGGGMGPRYGRTEFDYARRFVWDLKAHPDGDPALIVNDLEAIYRCIDESGSFGFVVAEGTAAYDTQGSFYAWHEQIKGGQSVYSAARIARGAPSRARKVTFAINRFYSLAFDSREDLDAAFEAGWARRFQEGMRNSNGTARRVKLLVRTDLIPAERFLTDQRITTEADRVAAR